MTADKDEAVRTQAEDRLYTMTAYMHPSSGMSIITVKHVTWKQWNVVINSLQNKEAGHFKFTNHDFVNRDYIIHLKAKEET